MRQLKCADAGFECDAVLRADSDEEILAQAGPHAKEAHGVDVSPEMAEEIRGRITDA